VSRGQPADDRGLLEVLGPEVRDVRLDYVKELAHDRADAGEVPRPAGAAECPPEVGHIHDGTARARVHLMHVRHQHRRNAMRLAARQVRLGCAGILRQVLERPELDRVHEDADGHKSALPPGRVNEAVVARVQRAHCRDQADNMTGRLRAGDRRADFLNRSCNYHSTVRILLISSALGR
jgi:hypothetical protein